MSAAQEAQLWDTAGITPLPYPHAMYEVPIDRELGRKGWARIASDPWRYARLTAARALDFWVGNSRYLANSDTGLANGFRMDLEQRGWTVAVYSLTKRLLVVPGLLVLAAMTVWVERPRWREVAPLYLFPLGLTLGYVPFCVEAGRYALPVLPCVLILAAAGVERFLTARVEVRP